MTTQKKPNIFFAHANGFPSGCYQQFFSFLNEKYHVDYIDMIGHNPEYPVTNNWHNLLQEVIDTIAKTHTKPVLGVGHSLGGTLLYMAAQQRPDLFEKLIILEAPLFGKFKSLAIKFFKKLGFIAQFTPGKRTKYRKRQWHDITDAKSYLRKRDLFRNFTEECLQDFIEHGMRVTPQGLHLKFDVDLEYKIFCTLPDHLAFQHKNNTLPITYLYGQNSKAFSKRDFQALKKHYPEFVFDKVKGGHLFPFEFPKETAEKILSIL